MSLAKRERGGKFQIPLLYTLASASSQCPMPHTTLLPRGDATRRRGCIQLFSQGETLREGEAAHNSSPKGRRYAKERLRQRLLPRGDATRRRGCANGFSQGETLREGEAAPTASLREAEGIPNPPFPIPMTSAILKAVTELAIEH